MYVLSRRNFGITSEMRRMHRLRSLFTSKTLHSVDDSLVLKLAYYFQMFTIISCLQKIKIASVVFSIFYILKLLIYWALFPSFTPVLYSSVVWTFVRLSNIGFVLIFQCFSNGAEIGPHKNNHPYQFMVNYLIHQFVCLKSSFMAS